MGNGFGGLIGGLLGVAILANVASNIVGKSARKVGNGVRAIKGKRRSIYW